MDCLQRAFEYVYDLQLGALDGCNHYQQVMERLGVPIIAIEAMPQYDGRDCFVDPHKRFQGYLQGQGVLAGTMNGKYHAIGWLGPGKWYSDGKVHNSWPEMGMKVLYVIPKPYDLFLSLSELLGDTD